MQGNKRRSASISLASRGAVRGRGVRANALVKRRAGGRFQQLANELRAGEHTSAAARMWLSSAAADERTIVA